MKLFLLTDTHQNATVLPLLGQLRDRGWLDAVLHAGDFTDFGRGGEAWIRGVAELGLPLYFVSGNHESQELCQQLAAPHPTVHYLDEAWQVVDGVRVVGVGGWDIFHRSREGRLEGWARAHADVLHQADLPTVLLTHEPPTPWNYRGRDKGSAAVASVAQGIGGLRLIVCGHLHQREPRYVLTPTDKVTVVNPGLAGILMEVGRQGELEVLLDPQVVREAGRRKSEGG